MIRNISKNLSRQVGTAFGNGHPIAAVVTTEKISYAFANGMEFFSSFGGNTVSCQVERRY